MPITLALLGSTAIARAPKKDIQTSWNIGNPASSASLRAIAITALTQSSQLAAFGLKVAEATDPRIPQAEERFKREYEILEKQRLASRSSVNKTLDTVLSPPMIGFGVATSGGLAVGLYPVALTLGILTGRTSAEIEFYLKDSKKRLYRVGCHMILESRQRTVTLGECHTNPLRNQILSQTRDRLLVPGSQAYWHSGYDAGQYLNRYPKPENYGKTQLRWWKNQEASYSVYLVNKARY